MQVQTKKINFDWQIQHTHKKGFPSSLLKADFFFLNRSSHARSIHLLVVGTLS